jgi:hypothetical protein
LWQIQEVPDACRTCSVVLSIAFCFSKGGEKKPKEKGKNNFLGGWLEAAQTSAAVM